MSEGARFRIVIGVAAATLGLCFVGLLSASLGETEFSERLLPGGHALLILLLAVIAIDLLWPKGKRGKSPR